MINYYDGQIADLLPLSYTEKASVQALSLALREGTRLLYDYAARVYMYASIDTMPDYLLDYLAVELRTQYYSDDLDIETKRALVRNTLLWYSIAGTPAAVEELVAAIFGSGEVEEWWEFDGEPYWFRIFADAPMSEGLVDYFTTMVGRVKNTRSWLADVIFLRNVYTNLYAATLPQEFPVNTVGNSVTVEDGEIFQKEGAAALAQSFNVVTISNTLNITHEPTATGYMAAAAVRTLTKVTIHNILSEEIDVAPTVTFGGLLEDIPICPDVIRST